MKLFNTHGQANKRENQFFRNGLHFLAIITCLVVSAPVFAAPPTASAVNITGTAASGQTLTGNYTYNDVDGDAQGASTFRWLRNGSAISGATSITYLLTNADQGTTIVFEVTPVAAADTGIPGGELIGSPAQSGGVVVAANVAPVASALSITGTRASGSTLTGNYTYTDADGDLQGTSTFRWLRDGTAIGGATTQTYLLTNTDQGRTIVFEVTPVAATGTSPGTTVQSSGAVIVANAAPTATNVTISGVPSIGETLTGNYTYNDADGDAQNVSSTVLRWLRNGSAISGATTANYTIVAADVGTTLQYSVTPAAVTGLSPGLAAVSGGLAISNTAPSITGQVVLSTEEETDITILASQLTITDPDSTVFTVTVGNGANYTHVGPLVRPAVDFNGVLSIPVSVSDGTSTSNVFNLQVTVTPVNDRPVISGQLVLSTTEDTSITVLITSLIVTDPDSTVFTLALQPGLNYTVAGNVVTPAANFSGSLNVSATVTDNSGALNATSVPAGLAIAVTAVNDLPVILLPIPDQNAIEGTAFNLNVSSYFSDADQDVLTFAIGPNSLPASGNIVFNPNTGVFSGTPTQADARDSDPYIINVTATDNQPGTIPAADQFALNIAALARANVSLSISVSPDPAMLNDQLRWTFTVRNAPGLQAASSVELNGSFIGMGLTVTTAAACSTQAPAGQVTNFNCIVGGLPPGGSTTIVLNTDTSELGDVTAFAIAAGALPVPIDPNIDDNSAQLAVGVAETFSNGEVQSLGSANVLSIAAGDVNGDGSADLVVGTAAGQPVQIYLSSGFRAFNVSPISVADTGANEGVALADFDGNGSLDLVVANGGGAADKVYRNDGAANFSLMATLGASFSQDVAAGDFNSDGNMDIVIAATGGNPVYRGDGNGGFTLQGTLGNANSKGVAVGAFDSGTVDDIVFANTGSASRVWVYNGGGNWFASRALLSIGDAVSVTTGNFGGNARHDLAFARVPAAIGDVPANPVLINSGNGTFGAPTRLLGSAPTNDIHAGNVNDTDGAGLDDLVFINSSGVHQIWVANGSGGFDLHSEQIADRGSFAGVLTELGMTDVGNPGGPDLAMGGAIQAGVGVFLNDGVGNLGKGDAVPPVLTLRGDAVVDVPAGTVYTDSGATALDNIDGDLSSRVVTVGSVNSSIVGAYTLTYNVTDIAGNAATPITRTVNIAVAAGRGGGGGGGSLSVFSVLLLLTGSMVVWHMRARRRYSCVRTAGLPRKES